MPYLFLIIGLVMVTASVRDTIGDWKDASGQSQAGLLTLLHDDLTGKNNFAYWILAILLVGAIGYIRPLQPVSRAFLVLVVIVLVLSNQGVFEQFQQAFTGISGTTTAKKG